MKTLTIKRVKNIATPPVAIETPETPAVLTGKGLRGLHAVAGILAQLTVQAEVEALCEGKSLVSWSHGEAVRYGLVRSQEGKASHIEVLVSDSDEVVEGKSYPICGYRNSGRVEVIATEALTEIEADDLGMTKAKRDVSGEARADDGKWTAGGGSGKPKGEESGYSDKNKLKAGRSALSLVDEVGAVDFDEAAEELTKLMKASKSDEDMTTQIESILRDGKWNSRKHPYLAELVGDLQEALFDNADSDGVELAKGEDLDIICRVLPKFMVNNFMDEEPKKGSGKAKRDVSGESRASDGRWSRSGGASSSDKLLDKGRGLVDECDATLDDIISTCDGDDAKEIAAIEKGLLPICKEFCSGYDKFSQEDIDANDLDWDMMTSDLKKEVGDLGAYFKKGDVEEPDEAVSTVSSLFEALDSVRLGKTPKKKGAKSTMAAQSLVYDAAQSACGQLGSALRLVDTENPEFIAVGPTILALVPEDKQYKSEMNVNGTLASHHQMQSYLYSFSDPSYRGNLTREQITYLRNTAKTLQGLQASMLVLATK